MSLYRNPNDIPGKAGSSVISNLHQLDEVIEMRLSYAELPPSVDFTVRCADESVVVLHMTGVRDLKVDGFTPQLWLVEIGIEDMREDQLEGIRFRVFSRYGHAFDCKCHDFELTMSPTFVWVFVANGAASPGGAFTSRPLAEESISKYALSGVLTSYPLDQSAYDYCVAQGWFRPRKAEHGHPSFVGSFTSASQEHYHYIDGVSLSRGDQAGEE